MGNNELHVYKMNDYEYWASHLSIEETNEIYKKEFGLDEEENPTDEIKDCDLDKSGMWYPFDDDTKEADAIYEYLIDNDKGVFGRKDKTHLVDGKFGSIRVTRDGYEKYMSFRDVMKLVGYRGEPEAFCGIDQ